MTPIAISIVEDNPLGLELLAGIVESTPDFQCVSRYVDAESALVALPRIKPDVVLMDINLPGQSGVECVRQLKLLLPATQFIMLTVYEDTNHIFQALAAGATGYLIKNASGEELVAAIREVLRGGSPMASNIARKVVQSFMPAPVLPGEQDLSPREKQVLDLLAEGQLYKEIAESLHIGVATVCSHVRRIYEKLHVQSRSQAVARYRKLPTTR